MLKLAANLSLLFTEVSLVERFEKARQAGFTGVEIQFPYDTPLDDLSHAQKQSRLPIVLINVPAADLMTGGNGLACVPGRESHFLEALELATHYASQLEVPILNVLAGRLPNGTSRDSALQTLIHNLQTALKTLGSRGFRVTSEAINPYDMPGFLINSLEDMLGLQRELANPAFGLQVDLYHMARMGEDIPALLKRHIDNILHIQFADCPGRNEPGTGELNWQQIFEQINTSTYQGWTAAEYRPSRNTTDTLDWMSKTKFTSSLC